MWGTWVVSIGVLNNYGRAFVAAIAQDIEAFYELRYDFVVAIILISPKSGTINKKWEGGFIHGLSTSYSHLLATMADILKKRACNSEYRWRNINGCYYYTIMPVPWSKSDLAVPPEVTLKQWDR